MAWRKAERILDATESGDAAINDRAIHPLIPELPFGGVSNQYHGKWGFEALINARSVMYHSAKIDPGVRYPPCSQHTFERKIKGRLTPEGPSDLGSCPLRVCRT